MEVVVASILGIIILLEVANIEDRHINSDEGDDV
jgi:hypothetical protein